MTRATTKKHVFGLTVASEGQITKELASHANALDVVRSGSGVKKTCERNFDTYGFDFLNEFLLTR